MPRIDQWGTARTTPTSSDLIPAWGTDNKPYRYSVNTLLSDRVSTDQIGAANGVASLGNDGKVPNAQLPPLDYIPTSQIGATNGVASLGNDGKVPNAQLPAISTSLSTVNQSSTSLEITTGLGTNAMLLPATASLAGLLTATDKSKLDSIAPGATVNLLDSQLLSRSNHTGTQSVSTITTNSSDIILGRTSANGGSVQEIPINAGQLVGRGSSGSIGSLSLGTGLNLSGNVLSVLGNDGGGLQSWTQIGTTAPLTSASEITQQTGGGSYVCNASGCTITAPQGTATALELANISTNNLRNFILECEILAPNSSSLPISIYFGLYVKSATAGTARTYCTIETGTSGQSNSITPPCNVSSVATTPPTTLINGAFFSQTSSNVWRKYRHRFNDGVISAFVNGVLLTENFWASSGATCNFTNAIIKPYIGVINNQVSGGNRTVSFRNFKLWQLTGLVEPA